MTPETCPVCGADIPPGAKVCLGCGADEQTGWAEEAYTSGLDLPGENFNYNEFVEREFGGKKPIPRGIKWWWWLVAIGLVALFILGMVKLTR